MIRLFVENKEVDLNDDVQVAISKQFEDLSNPTTIINDWSKTVSIPFTQNNHEIFGHIYNPDRLIAVPPSSGNLTGLYFDPYKKLDMRLQWNDDVLMTGYARMDEINQNSGKGTYEITLFGQLGKVIQELKKITFDTSTSDTDYLIHGEDYVDEVISKDLVFESWTSAGQSQTKLFPKWYTPPGTSTPIIHPAYKVTDIIGFAPNNSFSDGFDYETFQDTPDTSKQFTDVLGDSFTEATGIPPSTAIPDGMLPREIGEYRSYLQLPYIYWNKLFQIGQHKAEELTGYKFELDSLWFNKNNPYWHNLVYMLKPFSSKNEETVTNYYMFASFGLSWGGDITEYVQPKSTNIEFQDRTEATQIIDDNNMIVLSNDYTVIFNTIYTIDFNISRYTNLRINPANGLQYSFVVEDENANELDEVKFLMVDNDYAGSTEGYSEVLRFARQGSGSFIAYPKLNLILDKGKYNRDKVRLKLKAVWLNTNAPFLDNNNRPFTPTPTTYYGWVGLHLYNAPINEPISCMVIKNRFRSNSHFTLNDLWNKDYNLFDEIIKYCKIFRIGISVDEYNKKIVFKHYSTYFSDYTVKDWTNKIDKSKDYTIRPITFENKYVLFNYNDSESNLGEKYKEKYSVNYGEYRLVTDYNFNSSTEELFDNVTPSITNTDNVLSWTNIYDNHQIIYSFPNEISVYNKDEDNKQVDIFGAYYFHNGLSSFNTEEALRMRPVNISDDTGLQQANNTYFYTQDTSELYSIESYPYLDIVRDNNLCVFNTPKENYTYRNNYEGKGTIYSNFWENYLNERYNVQNKEITCYVMLKPIDYIQHQWNQFVKVGNQLCIVNKIYDYDVTSSEPTKVDLITIQDIKGYTTNEFLYNLDAISLGWTGSVYIAGGTGGSGNLGSVNSNSQVTFSNGSTTYTVGGVTFTIVNNDTVHYETISDYLDKEDLELDIALKNESGHTATFHVVRYSTYPYPEIKLYKSDSLMEQSTISAGARSYKLGWYGTGTDGLENKPTVTIEVHGTGTATIDASTWVEQQVMIQEGDDEWFRTEYVVDFNTNLINYSGSYVRITIVDKEGWHETRDYPVSI